LATHTWRKSDCIKELNTATFNCQVRISAQLSVPLNPGATLGGYQWIPLQTSLYFVPSAMLSRFSGFFPRFICGSIRRSAPQTAAALPSQRIFKD
jgi:hypothetical protein